MKRPSGVGELPAVHWRCSCGMVLKGGATHMNCPQGNAGVKGGTDA